MHPGESPDLMMARAKVSAVLLTSVERQPYKDASELKGENRRVKVCDRPRYACPSLLLLIHDP